MPKLNTLKSLGPLFRSSIKSTPATTAAAAKTSPAVDKSLKRFVSSLDASSASTLVNSHKRPQPSKPPSPAHLSSLFSISVDTSSCSDSEHPTSQVSHDISSKLSDGLSVDLLDSEGDNGGKPSEDALEVPYRLGGETVMKEFNALLKICIETANSTDDWMVVLEQVSTAYKVFISMKKQGFPIEQESYGHVLVYLIERGMVGHFHLFTDVIRYGSASTSEGLGYYEMMLYTTLNDKEKILEFINRTFTSDGDGTIRVNDWEMFEELMDCIFCCYRDDTISLRDGLSVDLLDSEGDNGGKPSEDALEVPYRVVDSCAVRLGTAATLNVCRKLGGETAMKEFNALLKICIETASATDDLTVVSEQVSKALEVFISMKEQGFPIEEESYGQVLFYLIDMGMVELFYLFTDVITPSCVSTFPRLVYYEMLLYIRVNDEEKIQKCINHLFTSDGDGTISLRDFVPRAVVGGGDC